MATPLSLSVNLNKVALLRNSRGGTNPSPKIAGQTCLDNGAYGLTLHWRADNRHTRQEDVRVPVKGKRAPTDIYELRAMGAPAGRDAEAIEAFEAGVARFLARDFSGAEAEFRKVLPRWPEDGPTLRYLEEINTLKWNRPGPDWDGVFTATTK